MGFVGILRNNKVKKALFPTIRLLVQIGEEITSTVMLWWLHTNPLKIGLDRGSDRKRYDPI